MNTNKHVTSALFLLLMSSTGRASEHIGAPGSRRVTVEMCHLVAQEIMQVVQDLMERRCAQLPALESWLLDEVYDRELEYRYHTLTGLGEAVRFQMEREEEVRKSYKTAHSIRYFADSPKADFADYMTRHGVDEGSVQENLDGTHASLENCKYISREHESLKSMTPFSDADEFDYDACNIRQVIERHSKHINDMSIAATTVRDAVEALRDPSTEETEYKRPSLKELFGDSDDGFGEYDSEDDSYVGRELVDSPTLSHISPLSYPTLSQPQIQLVPNSL